MHVTCLGLYLGRYYNFGTSSFRKVSKIRLQRRVKYMAQFCYNNGNKTCHIFDVTCIIYN
jgi:hypothetical protein